MDGRSCRASVSSVSVVLKLRVAADGDKGLNGVHGGGVDAGTAPD